MAFDIILKDSCLLNGIQTDVKDYNDRGRNLAIYVSADNENWQKVEAETVGELYYSFEPIECKYIRLLLGDVGEEVKNDWSIRELTLYGEVLDG